MSPDVLWQDREVRFDMAKNEMNLRTGEQLITNFAAVEDTKGNSGDRGQLMVTGLRIIWFCHAQRRVNISIGLNCIVSVSAKQVKSRVRGNCETVFVLTKQPHTTQFEFIFTNWLSPQQQQQNWQSASRSLYCAINAAHRDFNGSRLYRELRLRSAIVHERRLDVLSQETIVSQHEGIWNLAADHGTLGTLIVSNIRTVWFNNNNTQFNVSIPYLQLASVELSRQSRFGSALVLRCGTVTDSGSTGGSAGGSSGYVFGFRIDPPSRLTEIHRSISALHETYHKSPIFGVAGPNFHNINNNNNAEVNDLDPEVNDEYDDVIDKQPISCADNYQVYLSNQQHTQCHDSKSVELEYNPDLGLAIEKLPEGVTINSLWQIIT